MLYFFKNLFKLNFLIKNKWLTMVRCILIYIYNILRIRGYYGFFVYITYYDSSKIYFINTELHKQSLNLATQSIFYAIHIEIHIKSRITYNYFKIKKSPYYYILPVSNLIHVSLTYDFN